MNSDVILFSLMIRPLVGEKNKIENVSLIKANFSWLSADASVCRSCEISAKRLLGGVVFFFFFCIYGILTCRVPAFYLGELQILSPRIPQPAYN